MSRKYIKQLTVGGFQVFAEPVTMPLGPLTLIYGPNSAGKSAILDAMLTLADLCELRATTRSSTVPHERRMSDILGRHWRRHGAMPASPAEALQLGALVSIPGEKWALSGFASWGDSFGIGPLKPKSSEYAGCFSVLQPLAKAEHVDVEASFRYQLSARETRRLTDQFVAHEEVVEIGLGGAPILRFYEQAALACINLDHAALAAWKTAADLKWMASHSEDAFALEGGWFGTKISSANGGSLDTNAVDAIEHLLSAEAHERARKAESSFIHMFDSLLRASLSSVCAALRVHLVPASRAVPKRRDVTFLLGADATPLSGESVGILTEGLPEHLDIVRSAFVSELERSGMRKPPEGLFGERAPRPSKDPVDLVNRLLGDYLFRSSGYFVTAGVHEITSLASTGNDDIGHNAKDVGRKFLASLELRDSAGRRFNFEEVGSGLGYVLPVLLAVATSDAAFLQQPELHLHPALQSELADALIAVLGDSDFGGLHSEGCKQIIAETHSEHLLLRLLRRVRQAADPNRALDPHSIGREDVVVLYIDPRPEGGSTVKHLRIARDGEFIDRWPRGFFEERWGELFDE